MNDAEHNVYTSHSICYLDAVHTRWTAFKLLHIGYKYFARAYRISNFEGIKHNIQEIEEKGMLNTPFEDQYDQTFIQNTQTLIDLANANIKMKSNELAAERNLTHLMFP